MHTRHNRAFITKIFWVGTLLLLIKTGGEAQTPDENYKHLENAIVVNGSSAHNDLMWITPEIRAQLIQYASNTDPRDLPQPQFITPQDALFMLGDKRTIETRVNAYRQADGAQDIGGPPEVLPYLVDDLSHASSENHVGVPGRYSLMDTSVKCAYAIICQWPTFPAATRDWAQRTGYNFPIYGSGPNASANRMMRDWWEHNREAILARRYQEATWLPSQSEETKTQSPATPSTPSMTITLPPPLTSASQTPLSPQKSIPLWLYGIVILFFGLIFTLWYRSRPK